MDYLAEIAGAFFAVFVMGGFFFFFSAFFSSLQAPGKHPRKHITALLTAWILSWPLFWIQLQIPALFEFFKVIFPAPYVPPFLRFLLTLAVLILFPMWLLSLVKFRLLLQGESRQEKRESLNHPLLYLALAFALPLLFAANTAFHFFFYMLDRLPSGDRASWLYFILLAFVLPMICALSGLTRFVAYMKEKYPEKAPRRSTLPMNRMSPRFRLSLRCVVTQALKPKRFFFNYYTNLPKDPTL